MFVARRQGCCKNKPAFIDVYEGLKAPFGLHFIFCINLYVAARIRITLANTALRRLDYGGVHDGNAALLQDHICLQKLAVDLVQNCPQLPGSLQRDSKPPDGAGLGHTLIKLKPTELSEHQVPRQLRLQFNVGEVVPKAQKQRPKQRHGGISGAASLACAFRQKQFQCWPVNQAFNPVQSTQRRVIKKVMCGEKGGLGCE